ncbi:hypothetical protein P175DRAFT_0502704 [Aspergillus ochraceoroseus IBT 24754]|uniref:Uncharacterized protein n=1 Tax=Aspergillus ochraceoroseus IBT 24754 TaxID=1392256 RepID=A0A2T5LSD2_9EURO|nr:uncharacterized protein P175DRAFT_0502704 [Aspergillus ochraceoroseus IBT 24754]PTU19184.1 hypothetical protein P175DRAFT_0502704 [Aspergillus ochraceoroseus IBT 24754]
MLLVTQSRHYDPAIYAIVLTLGSALVHSYLKHQSKPFLDFEGCKGVIVVYLRT